LQDVGSVGQKRGPATDWPFVVTSGTLIRAEYPSKQARLGLASQAGLR
jgi:hypothetical protein